MAIDPAQIAALATWVVAFGTVAVLWWQTYVARKLNSANAVMELRERFDAPRMRRARRALATRLLSGQHEDVTNLEVASFFELIGALTHRRLLDREMVWEAFGTWTTGYYYALRNPTDIIGRSREELKDPLVMHEFEWLVRVTQDMDHGHLRTAVVDRQQADESRTLLQREAELDLD